MQPEQRTSVEAAIGETSALPAAPPRFMNVSETARYLRLNEKKVYTLAGDGRLPGTKATGKWLFPRELIDQWLMETSHGGVLTDRLAVVGGGDLLLRRVTERVTAAAGDQALVCFVSTGTQPGLRQLACRRADVCSMHWGPLEGSTRRHLELLQRYPQHREWILVRAFSREQGLLVPPGLERPVEDVLAGATRWIMRPTGSGSNRFLRDALGAHRIDPATLAPRTIGTALSEDEAAARVATGEAQAAPGSRAAAVGHGLGFVTLGWEAVDLVLRRDVYFRFLFRSLLDTLLEPACQDTARHLGGFDFSGSGQLLWAGHS